MMTLIHTALSITMPSRRHVALITRVTGDTLRAIRAAMVLPLSRRRSEKAKRRRIDLLVTYVSHDGDSTRNADAGYWRFRIAAEGRRRNALWRVTVVLYSQLVPRVFFHLPGNAIWREVVRGRTFVRGL